MTRLALHADLDRCTGCVSCVVACKEEHRLPPSVTGIRLVQVGPTGEFPELEMYYLPLACQQCGAPDCSTSCPTGALARGDDGVVRVAIDDCAGCGDCVESCPYDAVLLDPVRDVAFKCDLCDHLLSRGDSPACVKACPGKALAVVDLDADKAPAEDASGVHVLKPSAGTDPSGRFKMLRQKWKDQT